MERQSKGSRGLEAYCKEIQGPPRAVAPPKMKKETVCVIICTVSNLLKFVTYKQRDGNNQIHLLYLWVGFRFRPIQLSGTNLVLTFHYCCTFQHDCSYYCRSTYSRHWHKTYAPPSTVVTICTAQWSLYVPHSDHYMYRTVVTICTAQWSLYVPPGFNTQNFYVLPTQCIDVFCVDLRTNSDYFPTQH